MHDPFLSVTARYADIVLPAATYLETEDFYRSYGSYYMQYGHRAVAPFGEARSNVEVAQALAPAHGPADPIFRMSPADIVQELFRGATGAAAKARPGAPPRQRADQHRARGRADRSAPPPASSSSTPRRWPSRACRRCPTGSPMPQEERDAARWPLRLLTAPGYFQSHTAFSAVPFLREREGEPCCILHPDEARARGLADGQQVRLFNERGASGLVLRVSDEVQPGVALVPGQRPDEEAVSGTINMLCSDRYTDIGEGATYQSTFLDVAAWGP